MDRLDGRVELHEDRLDPVGDGVARVVDVVEVLAQRSGEDVLVVLLVLGVLPPQREEDGQGGPEAEEVLDAEQQPRLGRGGVEVGGRISGRPRVPEAPTSLEVLHGHAPAPRLQVVPRVLDVLRPPRQDVVGHDAPQ